jgi:hypothetical protein
MESPMPKLVSFVTAATVVLAAASASAALPGPAKLAIYYGYPSLVNSSAGMPTPRMSRKPSSCAPSSGSPRSA